MKDRVDYEGPTEMPDYLSDSPITTAADDQYGVIGFACALAKSLLQPERPAGTVLAINGPWGSGKTSIINLIRSEIEKAQCIDHRVQEQKLVLTEFKCWWFRGEDALMLAFLQHLAGMLKDSLGDKAKAYVTSVSRSLLQATGTVGTSLAAATKIPWFGFAGAAGLLDKWLFPDKTLDKVFADLASLLKEADRRFIVVIDDIDRLSLDESLAIFRLVKSVGDLPNVSYLLAFDRDLAEAAVQKKYPSEGPHFLEKIIQASFDIPIPSQTDLNQAILARVGEIIGDITASQKTRFGNLFFDVVSPYVTSPRHVARLAGAISVTWPAVGKNVHPADFLALETLRLYEPKLFKAVRAKRHLVTGVRDDGDRRARDDELVALLLQEVLEPRRPQAKVALQRLFPRLEDIGYGAQSLEGWDVDRRVCVQKHFDTYVRLALSDETLAVDAIPELIKRAGDIPHVQRVFREAARQHRRNGSSYVPVYFDDLMRHGDQFARQDVGPFLRALFEIHDEIDLPEDAEKGFMAMANTTLRLHWLIRRLTREWPIEDRTAAYVEAIRTASLDWAVDFARSARADYKPHGDEQPAAPENCLVQEDAVAGVVDRALTLLRAAAQDGTLIANKNLLSHLYCWRRFNDNDAKEVRAWTDGLLRDDASVLRLMRAMMSESYTVGMGFRSLGDRVATPKLQVYARDDMDIVDPVVFRAALERIAAEDGTDQATIAEIRAFLQAWDRKREGRDDD